MAFTSHVNDDPTQRLTDTTPIMGTETQRDGYAEMVDTPRWIPREWIHTKSWRWRLLSGNSGNITHTPHVVSDTVNNHSTYYPDNTQSTHTQPSQIHTHTSQIKPQISQSNPTNPDPSRPDKQNHNPNPSPSPIRSHPALIPIPQRDDQTNRRAKCESPLYSV